MVDFVYDDYGLARFASLGSSGFAARQAPTSSPPARPNNGADIFRAGVGLSGGYSYWRVDWVTLADPNIPIAEWTFDTDNNPATGASAWPAAAGVRSPGIEQALVVSSRGPVDPTGHADVSPTRPAESTEVEVVRGGDPQQPAAGQRYVAGAAGGGLPTHRSELRRPSGHRLSASRHRQRYNVTFRTVGQEPPVYTDGMTDALVALAQAVAASNPVGAALGADGQARQITGNFWMEDDQADTLAGGDVSKFSQLVDWSALAAQSSTPEPQPTGYSTRWYVSRLHPGSGQVIDDGTEGNFKPTL